MFTGPYRVISFWHMHLFAKFCRKPINIDFIIVLLSTHFFFNADSPYPPFRKTEGCTRDIKTSLNGYLSRDTKDIHTTLAASTLSQLLSLHDQLQIQAAAPK